MKVLAALLLFLASATLAEERNIPKNCRGLHAGITAQVVPMYTENRAVSLTFIVLNDSEAPLDVQASSWKIVIDGSELKDSGMIFGNGPGPVGGYQILKPGEHYQFGKALPIPEYFSIGEHKVSWKGDGFQSPTITVRIKAPSQ
jgi:hypothetical protein